MPNFFSPLAGFFKKIGGAGTNARTPGFVPESVGHEAGRVGGGVLPTAEAVPNLSITPKPSLHPPVVLGRDRVYANPLARDTMSIGADTSRLQQEAVPRLAGRDVKTELALRANDPNPDVRFDTPMQQARYDYVTRNGDPRETHRGFKAGAKDFFRGGQASVKQLPPGSSVAEVLGAFLGGGTGSTITGKVDPVALEERNFEVFKAPELYRDQRDRNEQQRVQADIQHRQSQAQREKMQADVAREEQDRKNAGGVPVGARGNIINGQIVGAPKPPQVRPVSIGGIDHLPNPETGKYEPVMDAQGKPMRSTSVITAGMNQQGQDQRLDKNIQSRERIAGQSSKDRREIAVFNKGAGSGANEGGKLMGEWAKQRKIALNEESKYSQDEVNAAVVRMNDAAEKLKGNPNFEVSGEGGWSYVKPQQGGGSPRAAAVVHMDDLIAENGGKPLSKEQIKQLQKRGYKITQ